MEIFDQFIVLCTHAFGQTENDFQNVIERNAFLLLSSLTATFAEHLTYVPSSCSHSVLKLNSNEQTTRQEKRPLTTSTTTIDENSNSMNECTIQQCTQNDGWISNFTSQKYVRNGICGHGSGHQNGKWL